MAATQPLSRIVDEAADWESVAVLRLHLRRRVEALVSLASGGYRENRREVVRRRLILLDILQAELLGDVQLADHLASEHLQLRRRAS